MSFILICFIIIITSLINYGNAAQSYHEFTSYSSLAGIISDNIELTDGSTVVALRFKGGGFITYDGDNEQIKISCDEPQDSSLWTIHQHSSDSSTSLYYFRDLGDNCYLSENDAGSYPICTTGTYMGIRKKWDLSGKAESSSAQYQRTYMTPKNEYNDKKMQYGDSCVNNAKISMGTTNDNAKLTLEIVAENGVVSSAVNGLFNLNNYKFYVVLTILLIINIICMMYMYIGCILKRYNKNYKKKHHYNKVISISTDNE